MSDPGGPDELATTGVPAAPPPTWGARMLEVLRGVVVVTVLAGIAWTIWKARDEFLSHPLDWSQVGYGWLALAALLYLLGSLPSGYYWHQLLWALDQRPPLLDTLRAFFIGHLGKYVPGKAMVVVLRAGLLSQAGVDPTIASVCVFLETLTFMAVAAFLGAGVLAVWRHEHVWLLVGAVATMIVAGLPTVPAIARRIVLALQIARARPEIDDDLAKLGTSVVVFGWLINLVAWLLMGLSYWVTLQALPLEADGVAIVERLGGPLEALPLATGVVALAMVAGFVSFIPGGAGAREFVLYALMEPLIGKAPALLSAVALRIVWLLAEVVAASILYLVPSQAASEIKSDDRSAAISKQQS